MSICYRNKCRKGSVSTASDVSAAHPDDCSTKFRRCVFPERGNEVNTVNGILGSG